MRGRLVGVQWTHRKQTSKEASKMTKQYFLNLHHSCGFDRIEVKARKDGRALEKAVRIGKRRYGKGFKYTSWAV